MAAKENITMTTDITVAAREIDFVTRFQRNWDHLRTILGIMRPIRKTPDFNPRTPRGVRHFKEVGC